MEAIAVYKRTLILLLIECVISIHDNINKDRFIAKMCKLP